MKQSVFNQFRAIIHQTSGIALSEKKETLLSSRIAKRMRALGLIEADAYLDLVQRDATGTELEFLLDAISTNTTHFFREPAHFKFLAEQIFKARREQNSEQVRVWSAASSSGEEPYSIAMVAKETLDLPRTEFRLLATDISVDVLKKALRGQYREHQFRECPPMLRTRYFVKSQERNGPIWTIAEEIKNMVLFKKLNLRSPTWPLKGEFEVIFCRNVMIYFDQEFRQTLVDRFSDYLTNSGYLFVSHSESLSGIKHGLKKVASSVYQKV